MSRLKTPSTPSSPPLVPDPDWEAFRRRMPVARRWAYFDHAAVAPLSGPAQESLTAWTNDVAENGDAHWPAWAARLEQVRRQGAALLGASVDEVALVRNTTEGINFVVDGYPWQSSDNVVLPADEFPSNRFPWQHLAAQGVEVRLVPMEGNDADLDRLAEACDARTRVLTVSWVGYASGRRFDVAALAEIAHRRGALLFLDAIQGLGVFPLDVQAAGVDFLAADGHKWLLGPEGAGLFYIRRELLDRLRPLGIGWNSAVAAGDFSRSEWQLKPTAARYEGGTPNMGGFVALSASLALLAEYETTAIAERLLELSAAAREKLLAIGATLVGDGRRERSSGIVSFELPGKNPVAVRKHLLDAGIVVSCRSGRLRISPHAYNNEHDIDRLVATLAQCNA
jgi:cysteine desulfurase/selenocysteine lyase